MEICNRLYGEVWPFQHCSMYGSGAWVKKEKGKVRVCVRGWFGTGTQETSKGLVPTWFLLKTSSLQMLMGRIVCHLHRVLFRNVSGNFGRLWNSEIETGELKWQTLSMWAHSHSKLLKDRSSVMVLWLQTSLKYLVSQWKASKNFILSNRGK